MSRDIQNLEIEKFNLRTAQIACLVCGEYILLRPQELVKEQAIPADIFALEGGVQVCNDLFFVQSIFVVFYVFLISREKTNVLLVPLCIRKYHYLIYLCNIVLYNSIM